MRPTRRDASVPTTSKGCRAAVAPAPFGRRDAAINERQLDIFPGGCARQQVEALEHEAKIVSPQQCTLVARQAADIESNDASMVRTSCWLRHRRTVISVAIPNVSLWGHVGGLIGGLLWGFVRQGIPPSRRFDLFVGGVTLGIMLFALLEVVRLALTLL